MSDAPGYILSLFPTHYPRLWHYADCLWRRWRKR